MIALGGIVSWTSLRVAGNKFDQAVSDYVKKKYSLAIGEQTSESVKIEIGSALPMKDKMEYQLRGRDLITGLPKDMVITSNEIADPSGVSSLHSSSRVFPSVPFFNVMV